MQLGLQTPLDEATPPVVESSAPAWAEKKLLSEGARYAAVDVGQQVIGIAVTPILLFLLTIEEFGLVTWALVLSQVAVAFATGGLDYCVMRFYYRWDVDERVRFVSGITGWGMAWSMMLAGVAYIAIPVTLQGRWALIAGCWAGLFLAIRTISLAVVRVTGALRTYAVVMVGGSLVQAVAELVLVWRGWGPSGYMAGYALRAAASMFVALRALGSNFRWRTMAWRLSPELRSYTFSVWPSVLFTRLLVVSDRLVVGRFGSLEALGLYGVASRLTTPIKLLSAGFNLALAPVLSRGEADGIDQYALVQRLGQFIVIGMLFMGSLLGMAVWFAHLTPWATRSLDLQQMVALLSLAQYFSGLGVLGQTSLSYSDKPQDASVPVVASAAVLLVGLAVLGPRAGGTGAAVAQVMSGATAFLMVMVFEKIRRKRFAPWHGFLWLVLLSVPCVIAVWLLRLPGQLLVLTATVATYGAMMVILGRRLSFDRAVEGSLP